LKKYNIIYADPPWNYRAWGKTKGKVGWSGAREHYPLMKIIKITELPVGKIAAENCALFLWTTSPFLKEGLIVIEKWGFTYKTVVFAWVKLTKNRKLLFGLGHYTRSSLEVCLLGIRGRMPPLRKDIYQVSSAPIMGHSEKPEMFRDKIELLYGDDVSRIELFARRRVKGWDAWGNELKRNSIKLEEL
jgi:N6-adenosine-specific RNA methylase IME4